MSSPTRTKQGRRPPAYQCYASDLIAQENYMFASLAERGLVHSAMNYCWVNDTVPANVQQLARVLGVDPAAVKSAMGAHFAAYIKPHPTDTDRLYCPELEQLRQEYLDRKGRQVEGARRGGTTAQRRRAENQATPLSMQPASQPSTHATRQTPSQPQSPAKGHEKSGVETNREKAKSAFRGVTGIDTEFVRGYEDTERDRNK